MSFESIYILIVSVVLILFLTGVLSFILGGKLLEKRVLL